MPSLTQILGVLFIDPEEMNLAVVGTSSMTRDRVGSYTHILD